MQWFTSHICPLSTQQPGAFCLKQMQPPAPNLHCGFLYSSMSYLLHFEEERVYKVPNICGIQSFLVFLHLPSYIDLYVGPVFEESFMRTGQEVHELRNKVIELKKRDRKTETQRKCSQQVNDFENVLVSFNLLLELNPLSFTGQDFGNGPIYHLQHFVIPFWAKRG